MTESGKQAKKGIGDTFKAEETMGGPAGESAPPAVTIAGIEAELRAMPIGKRRILMQEVLFNLTVAQIYLERNR